MAKLNLPNKLTLIRAVLVPFFVFFMVYPIFGIENATWCRIVAASIFVLAGATDFLDGRIARKRKLVTRFGKFMDPLADKFMVFAALIAINFSGYVFPDNTSVSTVLLKNLFFWMSIIIVFRELMVTSLRLVVASGEQQIAIPANIWGKIKTLSQMVCITVVILEPIAFPLGGYPSLVLMVITTVFTLFSAYTYIRQYWRYIDPTV